VLTDQANFPEVGYTDAIVHDLPIGFFSPNAKP